MTKSTQNLIFRTAAIYSKNPCQFLCILSEYTIREAEYDHILKIIASCACFREKLQKIAALF